MDAYANDSNSFLSVQCFHEKKKNNNRALGIVSDRCVVAKEFIRDCNNGTLNFSARVCSTVPLIKNFFLPLNKPSCSIRILFEVCFQGLVFFQQNFRDPRATDALSHFTRWFRWDIAIGDDKKSRMNSSRLFNRKNSFIRMPTSGHMTHFCKHSRARNVCREKSDCKRSPIFSSFVAWINVFPETIVETVRGTG